MINDPTLFPQVTSQHEKFVVFAAIKIQVGGLGCCDAV